MQRESTWALVCKWSVIRRAAIIAFIVGQVLAAINHGDRILTGTMTGGDWFKIALTFLVPYTVSTISSVLALREQAALLAARPDLSPDEPASELRVATGGSK